MVKKYVDKYYLDDGGETAFGLSYWKDEAKDGNLPINIELQKRDIDSEYMWCDTHSEFITRGEQECGKNQCPWYEPCNGKSGRCEALKNTLIGTGKFFTVFPDGTVSKR